MSGPEEPRPPLRRTGWPLSPHRLLGTIPGMTSEGAATWEIAEDPAEVHDLLCACDAWQAEATGTPVPRRRYASTERWVRAGAVHLLREHGRAVAMFTLSEVPPFDLRATPYGPARYPLYLQRLAVTPELLRTGSVLGAQCVRRAVTVARRRQADVLRAEANPDLRATRELLRVLGFVQLGDIRQDDTGRRWVYLERPLVAGRPGTTDVTGNEITKP